MTIKRVVILALLATAAVALAGCGGSNSNSSAQIPQQEPQTSDAPSIDAVSSCLRQSDAGSIITNVTLEPDPLDSNSNVLRIETTLAPGQYEGDKSAMAVLVAASDCGLDQWPGIAPAIIDRDGNDMGQ